MPRRSIVAALTALAITLAAAVAAPLVVEAGGGCHGPDGSVYAEGPASVVRMDVCSFAPTIVRVPVGTTIRFLNTANIDHMVVGRSSTWASDLLSPGREYVATFKAAGTYPFSCPIHQGMVGAIVVGDGVGIGGGASVGLPEPVVAIGSSTEPSVSVPSAPSAAASITAAASVPAAASAGASAAAPVTATTPARTETAVDSTVLGMTVVLAALGGVVLGALGRGVVAARRRQEGATSR